MSTLCLAERKWQKHGGAEKSESLCFCPTHFFAFQKRVNGCRRISDEQPFSEIISDLFFWKPVCPVRLSQTGLAAPTCPAKAVSATAGKSGKAHFFALLIFLPSFRWRQFSRPVGLQAVRPVKLGQGGSNQFGERLKAEG
jgi:hypothetical protein